MRFQSYHDIDEALEMVIKIELGLNEEKLDKSSAIKGLGTTTKMRDIPLPLGQETKAPHKRLRNYWSKPLNLKIPLPKTL